MKQIICSLAFLYSVTLQAQTKHALLIGIGDYDTKVTSWNKLNSIRDVELVKKTLERQKFEAGNITTLTDKQATKEGIVTAMKGLMNKVKANGKDVVYIHVSSHGAQIEDDNGDETDGLDEAIVSINARWTDNPEEFKKVQGDYLRDDEFGNLIELLRAKLGSEGDVVVVMDLCHSGTATRGEPVARGNKSPLISQNFKQQNLTRQGEVKEFKENGLASRGATSSLATYVVFSAARAEEAAYETINDEGQKMGALSYAFCKSMETLKDSMSYRSLFARVESIMDMKSNIQHPVLEGTGIDRGFLGGQFISQKAFVEVESIDEENKIVKIKAGLFNGLDEGAGVSFYPSGTPDAAKAKILAKGKVVKASQYSAEVEVDAIKNVTAKDVWGFVTEPVFKVKPIVLHIRGTNTVNKLNPSFSAQERKTITDRLKPFKQALVGEEKVAELILIKGTAFDSLVVANTGFLYGTTQKKSLEEHLKTYSKYKYLKELEVKDPSINVEVKLGKFKNGQVEFLPASIVHKGYEYEVGDVMIVAVKNKGNADIYINILDFQPDGIVNPIFPNKGIARPIQASELKVAAGQEFVFKDYKITIAPPLGSEVLKVFISDTEIDMEGVAREFKSRSFMTAIEGLVSDVPEMLSRGGDVLNLKEAKGAVFNIPFLIKTKQ